MTTESATPGTEAAAWPPAELQPAIDAIPRFLRYPIFLPTERVSIADAQAGLARVKALYDGELDATYRPRLRALKAARRNRRCFVIGNGPSLGRTDLAKLRDEVTFATNGFFLKMPELDWQPTYYVVEDHLVGEDRATELEALRGSTKLYPASLAYALRPDESTIYFDHRPRKSFPDGFDFSFDADEHTWTGGTVTFTCLQLAAYLGFQEIYLIGVDADYAIPADASLSGPGRVKAIDMRSDDPNHFHPDYFGKGKRWHEPNVETMLGAYEEARRATEARGVSIVNATVGGKLEVFPRIDYEMLFRPVPEERLLVIDLTRIGDGSASGEMKAAVLGEWPSDRLLQVFQQGNDVRVARAGGSVDEVEQPADAVAAFAPDLVLYRPVPRKAPLHRFAMDLIGRSNLPLAVSVVDDWPTAFAHDDPPAAARLDGDFRTLLDRASVRFSISAEMSTAFFERYGVPFVPIANGIDPREWPVAVERVAPTAAPAATKQIRVRYAGNLAQDMTLGTVELVARVIERLASDGLDMALEIRTQRYWAERARERFAGLARTSVATSDLSMADYRRWLADADILLIAYNFDPTSRSYIRYSLANKLPECLASGAPVLAVGPEDVGTISTMAALDVGERVTRNDESAVAEALLSLAGSPERRSEIARRGRAVAVALFDVAQTRRAFGSEIGRVVAAARRGELQSQARARRAPSTPPRPDAAKGRPGLVRRIARRARREFRSLLAGDQSARRPRASAPGPAKPKYVTPHGHQLMARVLPGVASEVGHVEGGHVIEVGSTRERLPGQGSTVVLASLAAQLGLPFITVDMDPANTEQAIADLALVPGARAETGRGEEFLAAFKLPIVAAYLDAFDIQHGKHSDYRVERYREFLGTEITNAAASAMHLAAARALMPRLVPGGLVVIDDTWVDGDGYAGKGSDAVPELLANGFRIVDRTESAIALRSARG